MRITNTKVYALPPALQNQLQNYSQQQLDKYGQQCLELFAQKKVGSYFLDMNTLNFFAEFLDREYKLNLANHKTKSVSDYKYVWLLSGMLLRQLELQLISDKNIEENREILYFTRIMYKICGSEVKLHKLPKLKLPLYSDPITVALDNMRFVKYKLLTMHDVNPRAQNFKSHIKLNYVIDQLCMRIEFTLTRLFEEFRLAMDHKNYEQIGSLLINFPFIENLHSTKERYDSAIVFLYGCLRDGSNQEYKTQICKYIEQLYIEDSETLVNMCCAHVRRNQSRQYANHIAEVHFRTQLMRYIIRFLSESSNAQAKINLLDDIRFSFDEATKSAFGHMLAQYINDGKIFAHDLMLQIYDNRLALHDQVHLRTQMLKFATIYNLDPKIVPEISKLVPEDGNRLALETKFLQTFDRQGKKILACTLFTIDDMPLNAADCVLVERYIFNLLNALRKIEGVETNHVNSIYNKVNKCSINLVQSLASSILDLISQMQKQHVNQAVVNVKFFTALQNNAYVHNVRFCTLINLTAGNWLFTDPEMPQGYIRIDINTQESVYKLARYLVDCGKSAIIHNYVKTKREDLYGTDKPLGALLTAQDSKVLPLIFRRSETPTQQLVTLQSNENHSNIRRVFSTPQFGPSSWY